MLNTDSQSIYCIWKINRLTAPWVMSQPTAIHTLKFGKHITYYHHYYFRLQDVPQTHLNEEINANQYLNKIIYDECIFHKEWFSILHKTRSCDIDEVEV